MTTIDATLETQLGITIVSTTFKTVSTVTVRTATTFVSIANVLFGAKVIEFNQGMESLLRSTCIGCKLDKEVVAATGNSERWFLSVVLCKLRRLCTISIINVQKVKVNFNLEGEDILTLTHVGLSIKCLH